MGNLTFQPILGPIVLTIVFLGALAMLLVGPSFGKLSTRRRFVLSMLRLGVICLALLATLRPGCVQKIQKNQSAVILFLIDATRSMELPHLSDDSTRWGAVQTMIRDNEDKLKQLADEKIEVKFFQFDSQTQQLDVDDGGVALPDQPTGAETDIGSAIYNVSLDVRDRRLLSVFVASDGVQNVLEPEIELTQAAQTLADMGVPLMAVQLGLPGDSGQLLDVAITSFAEQQVINKKNDLVARATMVSRGLANQDVVVELWVVDSNGNEDRVATEIYRPSRNYEQTNVELKYRPTEPGEYRIKVKAVPVAGEQALRNNELEGFLTVRDEGMRILFINGSLGWEQRMLRDSLPVLDFVEMDFHVIDTDPERWAARRLGQFESDFADPDKYDVFILCDVDARSLYDKTRHPQSLLALEKSISNGKGLLMLGGPHSFGGGLYHQTPLANVLPIKMKSTERQDYGADVRRDLHINRPIKIRPTGDSFLTQITDAGDDRTRWRELPELVGANRIAVKDTAQVYLESDDDIKRPIMAGTTYGNGRVLVFAGDSSWRWRRYGFKEEYDQFWRQVVLWLASWDTRNDETVSIELPKRRFSPGSRLQFDVIVKTIAGVSVDDVSFDAVIENPAGQKQQITINRVGDKYQAQLSPEALSQSGLYTVRVSANRQGQPVGDSEREFVVMDRDKEKSNPSANPEQMARLANQTREFGGRAIVPEEVADVLQDYIDNPPVTKIEIPTKWRLGETFLDATGLLSLFVVLLGSEWLLRKKWGLV